MRQPILAGSSVAVPLMLLAVLFAADAPAWALWGMAACVALAVAGVAARWKSTTRHDGPAGGAAVNGDHEQRAPHAAHPPPPRTSRPAPRTAPRAHTQARGPASPDRPATPDPPGRAPAA